MLLEVLRLPRQVCVGGGDRFHLHLVPAGLGLLRSLETAASLVQDLGGLFEIGAGDLQLGLDALQIGIDLLELPDPLSRDLSEGFVGDLLVLRTAAGDEQDEQGHRDGTHGWNSGTRVDPPIPQE